MIVKHVCLMVIFFGKRGNGRMPEQDFDEFGAKEVLTMPVSYAEVCEACESKRGFCGVAEDDPPPYGKTDEDEEGLYCTEEDLYAEVLQLLEVKYLEDRFSVCIEIRDGDRVVYAFPKLACPELFLERLKIDTRKL